MTCTDSLADLKPGDYLFLPSEPVYGSVVKIRRVTPTQIVAHGTRYNRTTGIAYGPQRDKFRARPATSEQIAAWEEANREDAEQRSAKKEARLKAEYEALPEAVKLARTLASFCDFNRESVVAEMPIDLLRAAVAWINERK